jgi:hypothetical protein
MANASSLTNCHKQKLPWSNNSKKAINVFKHRLEHLSISSWCCLQEFHQRPKKNTKQPINKTIHFGMMKNCNQAASRTQKPEMPISGIKPDS